MVPDHDQVASRGRQRARHKLAQLPVPEHDDAIRRSHGDLLEDLQSRGERLDEYRPPHRGPRPEQGGDSPPGASDSPRSSRRGRECPARCASGSPQVQPDRGMPSRAAGGIDLANHPLPDRQPRRLRALAERDDLADELVAGVPAKLM